MTDAARHRDETQSLEARTFIVIAVSAGFVAWEIGFDLAAFDTVDHRRFWAVWILSTIALISSVLFGHERSFGGPWRFALAVPSLWLLADLLVVDQDGALMLGLLVLSVATLPFSVYVVVQLLAADFFVLGPLARRTLIFMVAAIFLVGMYVGGGHQRFISCDDFARAGDFVPADCRP